MGDMLFVMLFLALGFFSCGGAANTSFAAERSYLEAVGEYTKGNLDAAETFAKSALRKDKKFFQAAFLLGKIHFFQNKEADALEAFSRLTKQKPDYTEARLWRLRCLVVLRDYEKARAELDYEVSVNPGDWRVYQLYALLANATGELDTRITMLKSAEINLEEANRLYLEYAKIWYSLRMYDRALLYLDKAEVLSEDRLMKSAVTALKTAIAEKRTEEAGVNAR
jgi:tetratricopeptide (TPR) repeat protein